MWGFALPGRFPINREAYLLIPYSIFDLDCQYIVGDFLNCTIWCIVSTATYWSEKIAQQKPARETGPALEAMYQFVQWLVPTLEKFPRSQKFLLGDRLQQTALDILERLIEATYSRQRRELLITANTGLQKLRIRTCVPRTATGTNATTATTMWGFALPARFGIRSVVFTEIARVSRSVQASS